MLSNFVLGVCGCAGDWKMDGADRRAGAIVFSLPVTDTAGLRLLEEEEPAAK